MSVVDPGFSVGSGTNLIGEGGADVQCGHFLAKMYAKMKELVPVGFPRFTTETGVLIHK